MLGAIRFVVEQARAVGTRVGICGEIAGNPAAAILLTAMGFDVLSMNAPNLPRVKWALRGHPSGRRAAMLEDVLAMGSARDVAGVHARGDGRTSGGASRRARPSGADADAEPPRLSGGAAVGSRLAREREALGARAASGARRRPRKHQRDAQRCST